MATVAEVSRDVFRISTYVPQFDLDFNHYLVRDDEPLLFHTGFRSSFAELSEAVRQVLDPASIRWVGFSHFESDECGALNEWLDLAARAQPVCSLLAAAVNLEDFSSRPARGMTDGEALVTGTRSFRFLATRHMPHGWDAGMLFEETDRVLFCSDVLLQPGHLDPVTESDIVGPARAALQGMVATPFGYAVPYTPQADAILSRLADLQPRTLAVMHGSAYSGDGAQALRGFAAALREIHG